MNFNKQQKEAILHKDGVCSVIAGAGAGKTAVLINRVKELIDSGINENKILVVSFTSAISKELKKKLKDNNLNNIEAGTFHSIARNMLFKNGIVLNPKDIITDWKIETCFNSISGKLKKSQVSEIKGFIDYQKVYMKSYNDKFVYKQCTIDEEDLRVYFKAYESYKQKNKLYDFTDWLLMCYDLVKDKPCEYDYILVDEHQDNNYIRNLLLKEWARHGNIFYVGDYRQCFPTGTKIRTNNGFKNIENIKNNDTIIVANGFGSTIETEVSEVLKKKYNGNLIEIVTENGYKIKATPNHIIFLNTLIKNKHFIYLMYREDYGFRIGRSSLIVSSKKSKVIERNGYEKRLTDEKGNKVWLIKTCNTLEEAMYFENYYAFNYGIPLYVFNNKSRNGILSQNMICKLFNSIDTLPRGLQLLKDEIMSFDYPHYTPQANTESSSNKMRRLNFVMFGSTRKAKGKNIKYIGNNHELSFSSIDEEFSKQTNKYLNCVKKHKNNKGFEYYLGRKSNGNQEELLDIAYNIQNNVNNVEIDCRAILINNPLIKFKFMPIMNAKIGMSVPVYKDGIVIEDTIKEINYEQYEGDVYDLNIDMYRNYIVNDIVVHNCIYAFNGAIPEMFMDLDKQWNNVKVINMDINYRSCKNIVDNANKFIKSYYGNYKYYSDSIANNKNNGHIETFTYYLKTDEGKEIANKIEELIKNGENENDIAVLYRNNSHADYIESELKQKGIKYYISENKGFFDRKETKLIVSYLKLLENPHNDENFDILFNLRNHPIMYIKKKDYEEIKHISGKKNTSLYESFITYKFSDIRDIKSVKEFKNNIEWLRLQKDKSEIDLNKLIDNIVKTFDINNYIEENFELEEIEGRKNSVDVLKNFSKGNTLKSFLRFASGESDYKKDNSGVKLLTIHASKGLEFKHVFIISIEDSKFPSDKADILEEVRLFYVAITRAKENLYISQIGDGNRFVEEYKNTF